MPTTSTTTATPAATPVDAGSEWTPGPLRPTAHWVLMPRAGGHSELEMVWEVPNPMPSSVAGSSFTG